MAIFNIFSKRQKKLRGETPDVFQYEDIPHHFRVQVVHIVKDVFGISDAYGTDYPETAFEIIHDALCREYGLFKLKEYSNSNFEGVYNYFLETKNNEEALDVIELSFRVVDTHVRSERYQYNTKTKITVTDAIQELNERFKEHGIGYQFESGELIRIDSQFLHSAVVKPVLKILRDEKIYKGANEEFLKAHEHYRHKRYKECLNDCLKSFESVMKSICNKHKWTYSQNDTSKKLISICFSNNLIPTYMQTQFSSFRSLLESGTPTIRNKLGGHGQGASTVTVDSTIASYALHLTASNILFLTESELKLK